MKLITLSVLVLFVTGCQQYLVSVDAISSNEKPHKLTACIIPGNSDIPKDDLQFQEFASYLKPILSELGYTVIGFDKSVVPGVVVIFDYQLSSHEEIKTDIVPIYGQTGYSSSYTSGQINTYSNGATYSESTTYNPDYGIIGATPDTYSIRVNDRYCFIGAYAPRDDSLKETIELWRTTISSSGSNSDLRTVVPVMLGAAKKYIGKNSGKRISMKLSENDHRVKEIKDVK